MSRGDIVRARIESLKTRGVKFTPALEKLVRCHQDRLIVLAENLKGTVSDDLAELKSEVEFCEFLDSSKTSIMYLLDSVDKIESIVERVIPGVEDLGQKVFTRAEEESLDLAEAIFAETVRIFEELLAKPIQVNDQCSEENDVRRNVCVGMG